jgi:hypothetical protein
MEPSPHFVLCIESSEDQDLEVMKVYRRLEDSRAAEDGLLRVVDESGEDYLYPKEWFLPVPSSLEQQLEGLELSRPRA